MKKLSIILLCALVALAACTKSKEVHPEIGDGNDEILTVGMTDVHVEYFRNNMEKLEKVYFNYRLASSPNDPQHHTSAEMTKREDHFELTLTDLLCDTLYSYYYTLMDDPGGPGAQTESKTFRTQACDTPQPPTPPVAELPTVVTAEVSEITTNSAQCGGEVTNNGGATVTERGICWGTTENPTLEDNHNAVGTGTGVFTVEIDGLQANTTYHVRAYATNEAGTAYGLDREFTTLSGGGNGAPEGAINGLFTINDNGDQVYFSQGNLQYQASTNTWRFAEHQFDLLIKPEEMTSWHETFGAAADVSTQYNSLYNGWIDLFGWGTSGWDNGNIYFQPYDFEALNGFPTYYLQGFGYGPTDGTDYDNDLTGTYAKADWGIYNSISNGGNEPELWRTLTMEEWLFVLTNRSTLSNILYAKAQVNDVNGLIILPDDWNTDIYTLNYTNMPGANWNSNVVTCAEWANILEVNGAVFLPAAGFRDGTMACYINEEGQYWSASSYHYYVAEAWQVMFSGSGGNIEITVGGRPFGMSVRLVQDIR